MAAAAIVTELGTTAENHEMILKTHEQYEYDRIVALRKVSKIQRELSRAEHELHRIERYLQRIQDFCQQNNVPLENKA